MTATLLSKHLKVIPGESPKVSQFKQTVSTSLERRLAPADVSSACKDAFIASFLDPRHKHLRFATEEVQCRPRCVISSKIKDHQAVFDEIKNSSESEEEMGLTVERDETQPLAKKPKSDSLSASAIAVLFGEDYNVEMSDTTELNQYCQDTCPPIHIDPMDWWKTNDHKYPRLAKLTKAYLSVPATSVPSERVFSTAGLIVNRLRSHLLPEHVNMLIFLNKNMK